MQMFLTVSNAIRQWPDSDLKQSFLFNRAEVVNAISMLIPLECDEDQFARDELSEEQCRFLDLLQAVKLSPCYSYYAACKDKNRSDYEEAVNKTAIKELEFLFRNDTSLQKELGISIPFYGDLDQAMKAAEKAIAYLEEKESVPESNSRLSDFRKARCICQQQEKEYYDSIIIHGVHRITPLMFSLCRHLEEKLDVKVLFLINYATNLPEIYNTWKKVYAWCDTKFEYAAPLNLDQGREIGSCIAKTFKGQKKKPADTSFKDYPSLFSFAIDEVGHTYKAARKRALKKKSGEDQIPNSLSYMRTQYYAVQGNAFNEILRMYYPEQFKEKPFLSYPVGQFILGLYKMWDFEEKRMRLDPTALSECIVSGILKPDPRLLDTLRKTKLFFSDVDSFPAYIDRIHRLMEAEKLFQQRKAADWRILEKVSFYHVEKTELESLEAYLVKIQDVSYRLFHMMSGQVDYIRHFRELIDVVSTPEIGGLALSKSEQELIKEISDRLSADSKDNVTGNSVDLSDALAFFLAGRIDSETSNWIVRDFMQIDGAVLLGTGNSKAATYHFALLSNEHMTRHHNDILPWPLTIEMFHHYTKAAEAVSAVATALSQKRDYLRYILFYGAFFSRVNHLEFSYISEEAGEQQTPYYLFSAMGLKPEHVEAGGMLVVPPDDEGGDRPANVDSLDEEEKELFSVCRFKYLMNRVLKTPIEYSSDFHIKYYLSFALAWVVFRRLAKGLGTMDRELEKAAAELEEFFPFWGSSVFADIRKRASEELNKAQAFSNPFASWYVRRKKNFLVAKWTDQETKQEMSFMKEHVEALYHDYLASPSVYPLPEEVPPEGFCNDCSFSEICLRGFYDARIEGEGEGV